MRRFFQLAVIGLLAYVLLGRGGGVKESMSRIVISEPTAVRNLPYNERVRVILFTGTE
jgi:hypothetical protein